MTDPIVITGAGLVTCLGRDIDSNFAAMCEGKSGVKPLQYFDTGRYRTKVAYEIETRPGEIEGAGRASIILIEACSEAIDSAGFGGVESLPTFIGTGLRELRSVELWWLDNGALPMSRLHFGPALREALPEIGHVYTLSNACSASLFALASAVDALRLGEIDRAVVGGVDVLTESMFGLLDRVQYTPPKNVAPFDRDRLGVLMGDGAAAVVVERLADARRRSACIFGVLRGIGVSCDAHHETAPHPAGMEQAIRAAFDEASLLPSQIDVILAHGTGTQLNDKAEMSVLSSLFREHFGAAAVTGIKSMTGHTSGASGLVGLITALQVLKQGKIPPTLGLCNPMEEARDADIVRDLREIKGKARALVNAFGFGGVNASVIVEREIA